MQEGGKKEEQSEKGEEKDLRRKKGEGGVVGTERGRQAERAGER